MCSGQSTGSCPSLGQQHRNGADNDIWIVDPREPASNRLLAEVKGGGWGLADFAPDGRSAVVAEYLSVNKTNLYRIDIAAGVRPGDHREDPGRGGRVGHRFV